MANVDFKLMDGEDVLMHLTVLGSAYTLLARRLGKEGLLDLNGLAGDLEAMAAVQPDPLWQSLHRQRAGELRAVARAESPK